MGCLRGVDANQAVWKPSPKRNSIWNLVLHMAYWKYTIIRKLNSDYPQGFDRSPSDFPAVPDDPLEKSWEEDKGLLKETHKILLDEIRKFPPEMLDEVCPSTKKEWTFSQLIVGIAAHDTYHIAQIQLLKRLYDEQER